MIVTDSYQLMGSVSNSVNGYTCTTRLYVKRTALGNGTATIHFKYTLQTSLYVSGMTWGNYGGIYTYDPQNGWVNRGTYDVQYTTDEQSMKSWDVYVSEQEGINMNIQAYTNYPWAGVNQGNSTISNNAEVYTAPVGLGCSNIVRNIESFTANVYISGWGGGGSSDPNTKRYRELQCWTLGMSSPRRYQPVYGNSKSGNITVGNSSSGDLYIIGNKKYTIGVYAATQSSAFGGWAGTGSVKVGDYTTRAYAPTLSVNTIGETSVVINYSTLADGGEYVKHIQYSLDSGSTWATGATVSTGSASSGTFTISGLNENTNYTLKCRATTSAGDTSGSDITFRTLESHKFYGSVSGTTKKAKKLYGSVNGQTKQIKKLYASVNGQTKRVF